MYWEGLKIIWVMLKQEVVSFGCMWCQPRKKFNRTNNSKLTYHPENLLWKSISCILWIKIEFVAKLTNSIPYSVLVVVVVLDNFSQRLKTVNVELFDGFHHLCKEIGHDMLIEAIFIRTGGSWPFLRFNFHWNFITPSILDVRTCIFSIQEAPNIRQQKIM